MDVVVEGSRILLDDRPVTLFGFRVASAALREDWTAELIAQFPLWREHGITCIALWLQGSSGGFVRLFAPGSDRISDTVEPIRVRTNYGAAELIAECGATSGREVIARSRRIVQAAAGYGMAVIVGIPYRYSIAPEDTPELMARRIAAAAAAVRLISQRHPERVERASPRSAARERVEPSRVSGGRFLRRPRQAHRHRFHAGGRKRPPRATSLAFAPAP